MSDSRQTRTTRLYKWIGFVALIICAGIVITRGHWLPWIGGYLVCQESIGVSDVILIDNVEPNYLLFERAQRLQSQGLAEIVLIPILKADTSGPPALVSIGIVDVMCRISMLRNCTTFEAPGREPISLNVARRSAEEIRSRGAHSVIIVTDGLRSRRAADIYLHVLRPLGISAHFQPVFGPHTPGNWFTSWHGIQEIVLQLGKLWYYKLAVL
jgi:uncharacterized SAM-binding protein YcdF (DUF218 family)